MKKIWLVMEQVYNTVSFERVRDDRVLCACPDERTARRNTPDDWEDVESAEKHEYWVTEVNFNES